MSDATDLDAIEARYALYAMLAGTARMSHRSDEDAATAARFSARDVPVLVVEVRRLRAEVEAAEERGARWALDAAERAVHVEVPALDPAEVCRARRGR